MQPGEAIFMIMDQYRSNPNEPWIDTPLGPCEWRVSNHSRTELIVCLAGKQIGNLYLDHTGELIRGELWDDTTPQQRFLDQIKYSESDSDSE
jgi:hypothetical protein